MKKIYHIKQICPECKLRVLRLKRQFNGELKLYCSLCKSYKTLPNKLYKKIGRTFFDKKTMNKKQKRETKKKFVETSPSEKICKNCGYLLQIRKYKKLPIKLVRKSYYFSEWEFCKNCNSVFFEDENRIMLTGEMKEKIARGQNQTLFSNPTASLFSKKEKEKKVFN